jgi:hypothetical protein
LSRFAPSEYVRPDWADAELAKSDAAIESARLNAPRHSANYVSPYSVQEPGGVVRRLTQVELLALAYEGSVPLRRLEQRAEELGGWPHAILDARYALKRALRRVEGVNFAVVHEKPDLDRAPLPLYEAARMPAPAEDAAFEQWLLSDMDLCRDVAEFAAFAHALRAGTYSAPAPQVEAPAPRRAPAPAPAPAAAAAGPPPVAPSPQSPPHRAVAGAVAVVLVLLAAILYTLFGAFQ